MNQKSINWPTNCTKPLLHGNQYSKEWALFHYHCRIIEILKQWIFSWYDTNIFSSQIVEYILWFATHRRNNQFLLVSKNLKILCRILIILSGYVSESCRTITKKLIINCFGKSKNLFVKDDVSTKNDWDKKIVLFD